ncbi:MAG: bifunctional DNA-formamidopyrimidine glycosylase/DNA-(apurinic or apyrimidinic site) lyase [Chloroflexi bacterium]|jgi:formamidopyrimidine-DNA glycosylase|nr:bifunctional DNA-formamidopyrimidine glycosylase/DNA-(apurinic or apyrimidinic site) lyase [Chloroflexota bacterium]
MPELPEVETIAHMLTRAVGGRTVTEVAVLWPGAIDRPAPEAFVHAMTGAHIERVGRRGKFLVFALGAPQMLLVHLRMSGRFRVASAGEFENADQASGAFPHLRVAMRLDDGRWLLFINQRKFGRFYLVENIEEVTARLGPEPLDPAFTAARLAERLENRRGEIKRLLLNQHFVAGIGNIYASEALWQAHIHPERRADTLTSAEITRLHAAIVDTLRAGIVDGGTSLEDRQYVYPDGSLGRHQRRLNVYDRDEELCPRCGYAIERIVQGQRSTYFCPACQEDVTTEDQT